LKNGIDFVLRHYGAEMNQRIIDDERMQMATLDIEERARYSRHLIIPEIGVVGQRRLKSSRILCIGVGGLGSPAALYLAAAGVGTLGLVDSDFVELSNLQRQILHGTSSVGQAKLKSACERIHETNPKVNVQCHDGAFTSQNAMDIVAGYDVVIDGTDNFPTRYLSSDVCAFARKPNIYGSIYRFDGQTTVFAPHLGGPCYRCLFPEPPPPGAVPNCAEAGVLGVLPGIIGTMQAIEAIKLVLGIGEPLIGRLIHFDALEVKFREIHLQRDPECPVCGDRPSISAPIDYELFCMASASPGEEDAIVSISVSQLKTKMGSTGSMKLLDVREAVEYEIAHIEGAKLISLGDLPERIHEMARADEVVVYCQTGGRSSKAVRLLQRAGFPNVYNLLGGIEAWSRENQAVSSDDQSVNRLKRRRLRRGRRG
jgi:adenylyltransferase/sulfurtransferase